MVALREEGFGGDLVLIGAEPEVPSERPPLSKEYLRGEATFEDSLVRPPNFYADKDVLYVEELIGPNTVNTMPL